MSEITEAQQNTVDHETKAENVEKDIKNDVEQNTEEKEDAKEEKDESVIEDSSINPEKSEDAEAGDDEDSGSDSEESLPPGLLERPVEILEQKRARKKITRFSYDDEKPSPSAEKKALEIPKGNGIKLKNHPRVEYQLQRNSAEDLKVIHKFFFGIQGNSIAVKKNIREFCGFVLDKDSPQYQKKEEFIGKFTVDNLKWAMTVCDVPTIKGNKEELINTFMDWCLCPKPQEKPVPERKKKEKSDEKKKKKRVKRSAKKMENGDSTSETGTPSKKAKVVKKKKPTDKKSSDKKAKIKITSPKPKPKVESDDTDSSDEEPLVQKRKAPPTNTEIRKYVENLLKDADLEVLTMKVVFQQVYEQYPEFDLTDRKAFIKETVKSIIS